MIKKIVIGILAALNSVLLIMIIISVATGWHIRTAPSEGSRYIADSSSHGSSSQRDDDDDEDDWDDDDDEDEDYDDDGELSFDDDGGEYDADNDFVPGV